MRIRIDNTAPLCAALDDANGRATRHTASASDVRGVALKAERDLERGGVSTRARRGARVVWQSGRTLPAAYKAPARTTTIRLERGTRAWYVVGVERSELWPRARPIYRLELTAEQGEAVARAALATIGARVDG